MKNIFTLFLVLISFATNAQFSIQPQIGLENSRTTIKSDGFTSFSPMGLQFAPRVALRMNYKFKTGHGVFFGVATSSPTVEFEFNDPQTARTTYKAAAEKLQFQLEGGYQFSSKPIALGKTSSTNKSEHRCGGGDQAGRPSCGLHRLSHHCGQNFHKNTEANKGLYMRIIPYAGLAFKPTGENEIETESKVGQTKYEYKAGWNTAFLAGTAFQFGSRRTAKFVVSVNYLKGIGNSEQTVNTMANGKVLATSFKSNTSSFNVSLGIPLSFKKHNTTPLHKQCERSHEHFRCGQYRMYYDSN